MPAKRPGKKSGESIQLERVRQSLKPATDFADWLHKKHGANIVSTRPGHVCASFPERDLEVETAIKAINPFESEKIAYERADRPVPPEVITSIEGWNRKHGRI